MTIITKKHINSAISYLLWHLEVIGLIKEKFKQMRTKKVLGKSFVTVEMSELDPVDPILHEIDLDCTGNISFIFIFGSSGIF